MVSTILYYASSVVISMDNYHINCVFPFILALEYHGTGENRKDRGKSNNDFPKKVTHCVFIVATWYFGFQAIGHCDLCVHFQNLRFYCYRYSLYSGKCGDNDKSISQ